MLSYRHAFHAGNFADVVKHTALCRSLMHLTQKPGAIRYVDTHAGIGAYGLHTSTAQQTQEYLKGIGALWDAPHLPPALAAYVKCVKHFNGGGLLNAYPGSPWFAQHLLRPQDRLELCELHPQDYPALCRQMASDKRVHCHFEDGFKRAIALMPPIERRGLVLIDPSYELKDDYAGVVDTLKHLHKRFATGVYLLWYPVMDEKRIKTLCQRLIATGIKRIQRYELGLDTPAEASGMVATGIIAINPPWGLMEDMQQSLVFLQGLLATPNKGYTLCQALTPE